MALPAWANWVVRTKTIAGKRVALIMTMNARDNAPGLEAVGFMHLFYQPFSAHGKQTIWGARAVSPLVPGVTQHALPEGGSPRGALLPKSLFGETRRTNGVTPGAPQKREVLLPTVGVEPSARLAKVPVIGVVAVSLIVVKTVPACRTLLPVAVKLNCAPVLIVPPLGATWSAPTFFVLTL